MHDCIHVLSNVDVLSDFTIDGSLSASMKVIFTRESVDTLAGDVDC